MSANSSALRFIKERQVWKESYIFKKKEKSEVSFNMSAFFLKPFLKIILEL